jgi:hypothetical protein
MTASTKSFAVRAVEPFKPIKTRVLGVKYRGLLESVRAPFQATSVEESSQGPSRLPTVCRGTVRIWLNPVACMNPDNTTDMASKAKSHLISVNRYVHTILHCVVGGRP